MAQSLPRFFAEIERYEDECKVAKILIETAGVEEEAPERVAGARSGGDERALRGLPAIGRGVSGTQPGTDPMQALLAREHRLAGRRRR